MKKTLYLVIGLCLSACSRGYDTVTDYQNDSSDVVYVDNVDRRINNTAVSSPDDNDLLLETDNYIIEIDAQPGRKYRYNIWADASKSDDSPDVVIEDGVVVSEKN